MGNLKYKISILLIFMFLSCKENIEIKSNKEIIEEINNINKSNRTVERIFCETKTGLSTSTIFYEKPNKIFFESFVLGRKEAFIYSDKTYWLWMRNFNSNSVFFCPAKSIEKTAVRDPFRPNLIKASLCVDEIPDSKITQSNGKILIDFNEGVYERRIVIESGKIKEQHWNKNYNPILSLYVLEYQEIEGVSLPKSVRVFWHEEENSIKIYIDKIEINKARKKIPEIPSKLNKINLEDY